jgi:hypothetical protein
MLSIRHMRAQISDRGRRMFMASPAVASAPRVSVSERGSLSRLSTTGGLSIFALRLKAHERARFETLSGFHFALEYYPVTNAAALEVEHI